VRIAWERGNLGMGEGVAGDYRARALDAIKWSVSGDLLEQAIRLAFSVVLARLLSPRDFGLIAMVTALAQMAGPLAELGLGDALVQWQEVTEAHRSSVFWVLLLAGCVWTGVQVGCATTIASLYGVAALTPLAVILSALFIFDAIGVVPRALLARGLEFGVIARLQCAAAVVASVSAVALAWWGFGVLGLAADLLLTSLVESLLLWRASRWRPRFTLRAAALRDLLRFSTRRLGARLLNLSAAPVDRLLIGKFLGSNALGLYVRTYNVTRIPVWYVSRSIVRVMFPSLSVMQHDAARIRAVYRRAIPAVALATVPMCLGLLATAEPLVVGVLGRQWQEAVPLLRILSLAGLVQSISALAASLYLSQGRTDLQLRLALLERLSAIAAIVLGLHWGVVGVATACVIASAFTALPTLFFAGRLIDLRQASLVAGLWPILLAGATMAAGVAGADAWLAPRIGMLARLAVDVAIGIAVYWSGLRLLRVEAYGDVRRLLRHGA